MIGVLRVILVVVFRRSIVFYCVVYETIVFVLHRYCLVLFIMSEKVHMTRRKTEVPLFGQPADLVVNECVLLPSNKTVMQFFEWTRNKIIEEGKAVPNREKDVAPQVAKRVMEVWKRASIPTTGFKNVVFKVLNLQNKCQKKLRSRQEKAGHT